MPNLWDGDRAPLFMVELEKTFFNSSIRLANLPLQLIIRPSNRSPIFNIV